MDKADVKRVKTADVLSSRRHGYDPFTVNAELEVEFAINRGDGTSSKLASWAISIINNTGCPRLEADDEALGCGGG